MSIVDTLNQIWTSILDVTSIFVMPDWNFLIQMLPFAILLGVVAPFITFTLLGSVIYMARKPRAKVAFVEGPQLARLDAAGAPGLLTGPPPLPARFADVPIGYHPLRYLP